MYVASPAATGLVYSILRNYWSSFDMDADGQLSSAPLEDDEEIQSGNGEHSEEEFDSIENKLEVGETLSSDEGHERSITPVPPGSDMQLNDTEPELSEEEAAAQHEAELEEMRAALRARGYRERGIDVRPPSLLPSFDLNGVAQYMLSPQCKNVIVMCGAGISVSAGIPDFRTPGTGLYDNLQKYDLPSPQSIFELAYFKERPDAFYRLCAELWPDNFLPTPTHHFVAELHSRGLLRRCFTQNIDSLEAAAGLPADLIVAAHGNFDRCSCIETGAEVDVEEVRAAIAHGKDGPQGWLAMSERHGGYVKPDIVFFGEQLPERFFSLAQSDFSACDLLIILGTSLKVHPFASLVGLVSDDVPRLLINREEVGTQGQPMLEMLGFIDERALDFDEETRYRDVCYLGDCDEGVMELARCLDRLDRSSTAGPSQPSSIEPQTTCDNRGSNSCPSTSFAQAPSSSSDATELTAHGEHFWVTSIEGRIAQQPKPQSQKEQTNCDESAGRHNGPYGISSEGSSALQSTSNAMPNDVEPASTREHEDTAHLSVDTVEEPAAKVSRVS